MILRDAASLTLASNRLRQGCRNQMESTRNGALGVRIGRKSSVFQWFFKGNQSMVFKLDLKKPSPVTLCDYIATHGLVAAAP
jgi:hypothetical protein